MLFILSLALWLLLNGRITAEIMLFGLGIAALNCLVCTRLLGWSREKDRALLHKLPGILRLFLLLLKEVVKANLAVIGLIYSRKKPESCYVRFTPALSKQGSRIALADCITLTPGTITGTLKDGEYIVHCLDADMGEGLENSEFVKRLQKLEAKP